MMLLFAIGWLIVLPTLVMLALAAALKLSPMFWLYAGSAYVVFVTTCEGQKYWEERSWKGE